MFLSSGAHLTISSKAQCEVLSYHPLTTPIRFRFLNEKLYSCTSKEAQSLFSDDPQAFRIYHDGFQQQLSQWPNDPQLWIADYIKSQKKELKKCRVADMGCGDARLVSLLGEDFKVYSFDLVAINENVTVCDMAHVSVCAPLS